LTESKIGEDKPANSVRPNRMVEEV
jgi:hypothetical protein